MASLKVRIMLLDKKYVDIIKELRRRNHKITQPQFSMIINGITQGPKADLIISETEKIVDEWEGEHRAKT